jgi:phosphoglycerol transferase MdoB-like AlkP superfamily enzyme
MESFCLPAKLYFGITITFCAWYYNYYKNDYRNNKQALLVDLFIDIVLLIFFTWFLNYLCIVNYQNTSWFLFIIYLITSIIGIYAIKRYKLSYTEISGVIPASRFDAPLTTHTRRL